MRGVRVTCAVIAMFSVGTAEAWAAERTSRPHKPATTLRIDGSRHDLPPWRRDGAPAGNRSAGHGHGGEWAMIVASSSSGLGLGAGLTFLAIISAHGRARTVNGPPCDGHSLRELRPHDQSGLTMLPLLAGRF
jgi:hypothetical protein